MIGQAERMYELNQMRRASKKSERGCPTIAIASGKGGTGKSFVAVNLAYALTRNNKRVLLVDLDANLSNVNIMMNIQATKNLYQFFNKESLLSELIHRYDNNLHFLFGESGRTDHPEVKEANIAYLFENLHSISNNYDFIMLDTASGVGEDVISILAYSDARIVVTTPEPTSLMDAYALIKLISHRGIFHNKHIIVNRCSSITEGKGAFDNLAKASTHFLKESISMLGFVEFSRDVSKSITNQSLYVQSYPKTTITRQIIGIAKEFDKFKQLVNNNQ